MKIVVLQEDSSEANVSAEELRAHWEKLEEIPGAEVEYINAGSYPAPPEIDKLLGDAEAAFGIWIGPSVINREFLSHHPKLHYIGMLGHGYEMYEQAVCDEHDLTLTNTIYGSSTIAEYGFALLMNICHHVDLHNDYIQRTDWSAPNMSEDEFCHTLTPQVELFGKTIGIVGLGNIGLHMAEIARGFGMKVIAWSRHKKSAEDIYRMLARENGLEAAGGVSSPVDDSKLSMKKTTAGGGKASVGSKTDALADAVDGVKLKELAAELHARSEALFREIRQVETLDEIYEEADVVSLHVPHTKETEHLIDAAALKKMKKSAILINTARGKLIDEEALADALKSGEIYAAGLDVLAEEPPKHGSPLIGCPHCTITGHIAWLTHESRLRAVDMAVAQYKSYLAGHPVSVIRGY